MSFFSRLGTAIGSVLPITGLGLLCMPVAAWIILTNPPNHGTSGGLGAVVMAGLVFASIIAALILSIPAVLIGFPWLLSFLICYVFSLTGIMFLLSR